MVWCNISRWIHTRESSTAETRGRERTVEGRWVEGNVWYVCLHGSVVSLVHLHLLYSFTVSYWISLEDIQRRALQIILGNMSYEDACYSLNIDSLADRRLELCKKLFRQIVCESHNLHYLLPTKRDCQVTDWLRSSNKYPVVRARTDRCKRSFIMHSLANLKGRLMWHCTICFFLSLFYVYVCMYVCLMMFNPALRLPHA